MSELRKLFEARVATSKKLTESPHLWLYQNVLRSLLIRISGIFFLIVVPILLWATPSKTSEVSNSKTIRVAIVKQAANVIIDGKGLLVRNEKGGVVVVATPVRVTPGKNGILAGGSEYQKLSFVSAEPVRVNGQPYRGMAELSYEAPGILVVNELPLEDYLVGLINCEISSAWPVEAVKAQAIVARSYALYRKMQKHDAPYHLESSVLDQVYKGSRTEDSRARFAVSQTEGEVLMTYWGAIIQAFYHSSCGGRTESAENVWGIFQPYLKGVNCEYCLGSPSAIWAQKLSLSDIENKLRAAGFKISGVRDIKTGWRNNSGRMENVTIVSDTDSLTLTGDQFRKTIGYGVVKSTNFTVKISGNYAVFNGKGNGHGVGMCQWGSRQRALNGFNYVEILSYYYPGTVLEKVY